jgi:hypothetical protein
MEEKTSLKKAILTGWNQAIKVIIKICKIVIPVYLFVQLLAYTGILPKIALYLTPLMRIFGLPGDAAIVILLANCINIYAGIGALGALTLTAKQITILAVMVTTSHSLFIETSIIHGLNIPRYLQLLLRIGMMIVLGILMNLLWR